MYHMNGLLLTLYQFIRRTSPVMYLTTVLFLSLASCPRYLKELLWVDFFTIFIVIIFCILLNMVSLNIAPLVPIYLRATMIEASLYNLENSSQLFISVSLKPSIWFRTRNCKITHVWCTRCGPEVAPEFLY